MHHRRMSGTTLVLSKEKEEQKMESIIAMLISALMIVESDGRADAIGDNGRAVGVLQIHPECVQDINRFSKRITPYQTERTREKV